MYGLKTTQLSLTFNKAASAEDYQKAVNRIELERNRNTTKYLSEGVAFLALILLGAVFVYRAVRQQIKLQQQEQNFMMAITHELKTPIAVAKLNLETLQKHQLEESKRQKLIQMTLQETNRLNNLASNILVSSQLEGGRNRAAKEELNFSDLVNNCVQDFRHRFPDRRWESQVHSELDMEGDPLLLEILVNNLLQNAVKYSPRDGVIACDLQPGGEQILLSVTDQGPGIPDGERKEYSRNFIELAASKPEQPRAQVLASTFVKRLPRITMLILR